MANTISKVVYGDNTLIDLTADTVTASNLLQGITAHNNKGEHITGTLEPLQLVIANHIPTSNKTTATFNNLPSEPKAFAVMKTTDTSGSTTRIITDVFYNGDIFYCHTMYRSGSSATLYAYTTIKKSYSNGTLTLTSAGSSTNGYFASNASYRLFAIC
jgi:hypothetical protein